MYMPMRPLTGIRNSVYFRRKRVTAVMARRVGFKERATHSDRRSPLLRLFTELNEENKQRAFDFVSQLHQLEKAQSAGARHPARGPSDRLASAARADPGAARAPPPCASSTSDAARIAHIEQQLQQLSSVVSPLRGLPADHLDSLVSSVFAPTHSPQLGVPPAMPMQSVPYHGQALAYPSPQIQSMSPHAYANGGSCSPNELQITLPPPNYPPAVPQHQQPQLPSPWRAQQSLPQWPAMPMTQQPLSYQAHHQQIPEEVEVRRNMNSSCSVSHSSPKPAFMSSLTSMHNGGNNTEALMKERQRQEWLRDLDLQVKEKETMRALEKAKRNAEDVMEDRKLRAGEAEAEARLRQQFNSIGMHNIARR